MGGSSFVKTCEMAFLRCYIVMIASHLLVELSPTVIVSCECNLDIQSLSL